MLDNITAQKDIIVHGDGSQTRSFTYIDDVMDAFYRLISSKRCYNHIFNVGNPRETTIDELAHIIKKICKSPSRVRCIKHNAHYGDSYEDISRRVPDISKIKKFVGWEPSVSLEKGLEKTIKYRLREKNVKRASVT